MIKRPLSEYLVHTDLSLSPSLSIIYWVLSLGLKFQKHNKVFDIIQNYVYIYGWTILKCNELGKKNYTT